MIFAREHVHLQGFLQKHAVAAPVHPDDYFWRGEASIAFSPEFVDWQKKGSPAIIVNSIAIYDLPKVDGFYCIRADSHNIISEAHKVELRNKHLYFSTGRLLSINFPTVQTSNNFSLPVTLSSPLLDLRLTITVYPYYLENPVAQRYNLHTARTEFSPTLSIDSEIRPNFDCLVSFMRRGNGL